MTKTDFLIPKICLYNVWVCKTKRQNKLRQLQQNSDWQKEKNNNIAITIAVLFDPTCAFRTMGSYVPLSVCLYGLHQKSDWIVIHISESIIYELEAWNFTKI